MRSGRSESGGWTFVRGLLVGDARFVFVSFYENVM